MRNLKSILIILSLFAAANVVLTGCKKENDDPKDHGIEDYYLTRVYSRELDPTAVWDTVEFAYDAEWRLTDFGKLHLTYNTDGTLHKAEHVYYTLRFFYNSSAQIEQMVMNNDSYADTISLFYGNDDRISYLTNTLSDRETHFSYDAEGRIIKKEHYYGPQLYLTTTYEWVDGNMVRSESSNSLEEFQFDTKMNYAKAMHFPKELLVAIQLEMVMDMRALNENNWIFEQVTVDGDIEYSSTCEMEEYNEAGLPLKLKSQGEEVIMEYEKR